MRNIFEEYFQEVVKELNEAYTPFERGLGTQRDLKVGEDAEIFFDQVMQKTGFKSVTGTPEDDKIKHIDKFVYKVAGGEKVGIDGKIGGNSVEVKGKKYTRPPERNVLIEVVGGTGHRGWVYGESDYTCYDVPDLASFVFFDTKELAKYVEKRGKFHLERDNRGHHYIVMNDGSGIKLASSAEHAVLPYFFKRNEDAITRLPLFELIQSVKNVPFSYTRGPSKSR